MNGRTAKAAVPAVLCLLAVLAVWDRRLPYAPVDPVHEGFHLAWANCVLHGQRPQLEVRTTYGFLQTQTLAWALRAGGPTVLTWRRWILAVKIAAVVLLVLVLWQLRPAPVPYTVALVLILAAVPNLFMTGSHQFLRVMWPLAGLVILSRPALAGGVVGASLWWSPEYAIAALAAGALGLAAGGRALVRFSCGAAAALLFPVLWTGLRWPALVWHHLEFMGGRLGGYGWLAVPSEAVFIAFPILGLVAAAAAFRARGRDPLALPLAAYAAAALVPALLRADWSHLEMAIIPIGALIMRVEPRFSPRPVRFWIVAAAVLLPLLRMPGAEHLVSLRSRWVVSPWEVEAAAGTRREPRVARLAGLRLNPVECVFYERLTRLLECASRPDERVFLMVNEHILYFLADRLPATGYIYYVTRRSALQQEELNRELAGTHPLYVLLSAHSGSDIPDRVSHAEVHGWLRRNTAPLLRIDVPWTAGGPVLTGSFEVREDLESYRRGTGRTRLLACGYRLPGRKGP